MAGQLIGNQQTAVLLRLRLVASPHLGSGPVGSHRAAHLHRRITKAAVRRIGKVHVQHATVTHLLGLVPVAHNGAAAALLLLVVELKRDSVQASVLHLRLRARRQSHSERNP